MPRGPRFVLDAAGNRVVDWLNRVAEDGLLRLLVRRARGWFGHRLVQSKLLSDEIVVAEVLHSGVRYVPAVLVGLVGLLLAFTWLPFVTTEAAWFALVLVLALLGWSSYRVLDIARDRFVITDSRVFRVWGVVSLHEAEMEIGRVLDVTVSRPFWLRPFRSGHLVLENAAQQQGLKDIRYVPRPERLAQEIHRLRRAGVQARFGPRARAGYRPRADHPADPVAWRR